MAKIAVTRTVEKTDAICLIFDRTTAEPMNRTVTIPTKLTDPKHVERAARRIVESDDNLRLIEVLDYKTNSAVLGITDEIFSKYAIPLDPKTRKPLPVATTADNT